ncbi:MAG: glycosyltransferase family A protein, partial [Paracoccaceae bacterium]
ERPQKLDRAIRSVLAQNHPDLTLHLLLSGPNARDQHRGLEHLTRSTPNLKTYISRKRFTAAQARNYLMDRAGPGTLAFLDSDDAWQPDHLATFLNQMPKQTQHSILYTAPYIQRQSGATITPNGAAPSLGSLTKQPLLISSLILLNPPKSLRFRNTTAEDFLFFADAIGQMEHWIMADHPTVTYDQENWARKTLGFKIKRTYSAFERLLKSHPKALFYISFFSAHYLRRRLLSTSTKRSPGQAG